MSRKPPVKPKVIANPHADNPLLVLQNNPEFVRIKELLHRDPSQINAVIEHIATSCPELLDTISGNRANFFELMGVDKASMMLYDGGFIDSESALTGKNI